MGIQRFKSSAGVTVTGASPGAGLAFAAQVAGIVWFTADPNNQGIVWLGALDPTLGTFQKGIPLVAGQTQMLNQITDLSQLAYMFDHGGDYLYGLVGY